MSLILFLACTGGVTDAAKDGLYDNDTGESDTDTDADADTDTDTDTDVTVTGMVQVLDFNSGAQVPEVDLTFGEDSWETGKGAYAEVSVPGSSQVTLQIDERDWMVSDLFLATDGNSGWTGSWYTADPTVVEIYGRSFGGGYDANLGDLVVSVLTEGDAGWEGLVGASVDLDVSYTYAMAQHDGAFRAQNSIETGGNFVYFGGVAVGKATITVTTPDGSRCGAAPAVNLKTPLSVDVTAGHFHSVRVLCAP